MKHLLPSGRTLALFAAVAIGCAAIATFASSHDLAMAGFALPIFAFAAWMGMRGSGQWASLSNRVAESVIEVEDVEEFVG